MLRKASHIIFSALLLIATVGMTISKHYCGGNHVSTSFFVEAKSCCDSGGCCQNETETFQLDEDFSVSSIIEVPETAHSEIISVALVLLEKTFEENENKSEFIISDLPPPPKIQTSLSKKQLYLL